MKILVAALGLVIGAFLGAALLMLNPISLTQARPAALSGAVRTLEWESGGGYRGMPLTPGGLMGLKDAGARNQALTDPAIRYARVEVVALAGDNAAAGVLGVRLSATSHRNSLLQARLGVITDWNLLWPGEGSVMLAGSENFWSPLRDGLWSAVRGRGFQPGRDRYPLPPVPGEGAAGLVAGSGRFAGVHGTFREEFTPVPARPGDLVGVRRLLLAVE